MGPAKLLLTLTGAAALLSTAVNAADFPPAMPAPMPQLVRAPPPPDPSGFYLRGDIGIGNQNFTGFPHFPTNESFVWPESWRIDQKEMKSAPFIGFGIGYSWNNWLRIDVTGEYRSRVPFKVLGSYTEFCPGGRCFDAYDGNHDAWVGLVNAYLDLGTWWCVTPFIGVGIGGAYHTVYSHTDVGYVTGPGTTGFGYAEKDFSKLNMAWAFHAGLGYEVTSRFKVELAYRYLNLGDVQTSTINCSGASCSGSGPRAYYNLESFTSHDFKIGMRWMLQPEPVVQPTYAPPPLMRRG
jgi:opacity protein-like surface antigen